MLDPQAKALLQLIEQRGLPAVHQQTPVEARAAYRERRFFTQPAEPAMAEVRDLSVPGPGGAIPCRSYRPAGSAADALLPCLVYFHGGGFVIGDLDTHDVLCRQLSNAGACAVVSVDYRMGPEHRFPAAVDDCLAVTRWVAAQAASLRLDPKRLAVGGDSAGGTLAAVCAIEARRRGLPLALQLLFYPGTCAQQDTPSHKTFGHGFLLEQEAIQWMFSNYLSHPAQRTDWRFAPLDGCDERGQSIDVEGVAPAWMGLAECDPLVDEGVAYADKLRLAGVSVDLEIYRGVVHEFIKMGRLIPEAHTAHQDAARALRRAFGSDAIR